MRSWQSWSLRIVIAASLILIAAFMDHYVTHRSFVSRLIFGVLLLGSMALWRYVGDAPQRRRSRAQQQPSSGQERDASGG